MFCPSIREVSVPHADDRLIARPQDHTPVSCEIPRPEIFRIDRARCGKCGAQRWNALKGSNEHWLRVTFRGILHLVYCQYAPLAWYDRIRSASTAWRTF